MGYDLPPQVDSPDFMLSPQSVWSVVELFSWELFPTLAPPEKTQESIKADLKKAFGERAPQKA